MYYNRPARAANALAQFADQSLHLPGTIAKVNRCFYYPDGHHPADISETELAKRAGFAGNSLAEAGFFIWLYALPPNLPVQLLDLLYWEHHAGVWSACGLSFGEGLVDSVPPMNCRRFLEVGLSTRVEDRKAPYALVRRIIGLAQPGLLEYRFNQDWVDDWHRFRSEKIPLPWSVKQTLGWIR